MIIINLIQNIALLVALAATYQVIASRFEKQNVGRQILSGLLFGGVGLVGMMTPLNFMPGIIFDGRSIILSVSGLFGGPLVAVIAATMCGAYRLWLGGAGVWVGTSVILESAALGIVFHFIWRGSAHQISAVSLWIFGLLVHAVMLALMLALPGGAGPEVLRQIGLTILVVYPVATMLICQIFQDYERQLQERKALRESEEKYRSIFDNSIQGIYRSTPDGRFIAVNPAYARMFGYGSPEEMVGEVTDIASQLYANPADREEVKRRFADEVPLVNYELECRRKDGTHIWGSMNARSIRDESGKILYHEGVTQDITARKSAEEALRKSEALLNSIIQQSPFSMFICDSEGTLIKINPACKKWVRVTDQDVVGKYNLLKDEAIDAQGFMPMVRRVFENGEQANFELEWDSTLIKHLEHKEAFKLILSVTIFSVKDTEGRITNVVCQHIDITDRKQAQEALRESEEQYRAVFENAGIGIDLIDRDGRIVKVNKALLNILRYGEEELRRLTFLDVTHPDDKEISRRGLGALMAGEVDSYRLEKRYLRKDGSIVWVDLWASAIRDEKGDHAGAVAVIEDITERKEAEEALRQSEARYRLLVENVNDAIFVAQDGLLKSPNYRLALMTGYNLDELIEQPFAKFIHPEDADMVLDRHIQRVSVASELASQYQFRLLGKDGSPLWVELSVTLIEWEGKPATLNVLREIAERKLAEDLLRRSNELLEKIFATTHFCIVILDTEFNFVRVNQAYARACGHEREFLTGKNHFYLYPHEENEAIFRKVVETGRPYTVYAKPFEFPEEPARGVTYWDWSLYPLTDDRGTVEGLIFILLDVTEQKTLEKQLFQAQKMEAIGTLAGGIAHDFNNLLTVVLGFSELLLAEKDEKHPDYEDLRKVLHAAQSGAELVQRLLMFSRKSEPKLIPMDLNRQISKFEKLLRRTIPKMIDIKLDLSDDLPDTSADPSQVEQVLMNLAVNARDAMPDGGKLIVKTGIVTLDDYYCRLHLEARPGEHVLLEVSDTGYGMDKETVKHIFEPFYTTKEMGRGTGLGLATVYGIVKQHNGHIDVYSEVGRGTTFRVYLPAIPTDKEAVVEESDTMPAFGTETILLVDDEEFVRELGTRILAKQGYTVLRAENGKEALDIFKKERSQISLVILDLIMPEMGGRECLKELLKIEPKVKVLIASGFSADASVRETIQMGAKGFASKPFRVNELLRDVRRVLDEG